jgi:cellulose synthase (UDP-forming)
MYASRNTTFFDKIMPALGAFGVCPFVGTNAIFRRTALEQNGGVPQQSVTEDTALSLELHLLGYKSLFARNAIAFGTSPQSGAEVLTQVKAVARS